LPKFAQAAWAGVFHLRWFARVVFLAHDGRHGHRPACDEARKGLSYPKQYPCSTSDTSWTKEVCMLRARLASLALASSLCLVCGCFSLPNNCFSRRQATCPECDTCAATGVVSGFEGPVLVPQDNFMPDMIVPPPPLPGSPTSPPPRIVPVPQANPSPYTPTGLRRFFSREP
jgi:hypothetical protein